MARSVSPSQFSLASVTGNTFSASATKSCSLSAKVDNVATLALAGYDHSKHLLKLDKNNNVIIVKRNLLNKFAGNFSSAYNIQKIAQRINDLITDNDLSIVRKNEGLKILKERVQVKANDLIYGKIRHIVASETFNVLFDYRLKSTHIHEISQFLTTLKTTKIANTLASAFLGLDSASQEYLTTNHILDQNLVRMAKINQKTANSPPLQSKFLSKGKKLNPLFQPEPLSFSDKRGV